MSQDTCAVEDCQKVPRTRGWCGMHYQRWHKTGTTMAPPKSRPKTCRVDECDRKAVARALCSAHWQRLKKNGELGSADVRQVVRQRDSVCSLEGCDRPHASLGYCALHASRFRKTGDPGPLEVRFASRQDECDVEGCDRSHSCGGYCEVHYNYVRRGARHEDLKPIRERINPEERDSEGNKRCTACRGWKATSDFGVRKQNADGLHTACIRCQRKWLLERLYRMPIEVYEVMLKAQAGVCSICSRTNSNGKALFVDHDHRCCATTPTCGKCTRQLLCGPCNHGIGYMQDNPDLLRKAAAYLESHRG